MAADVDAEFTAWFNQHQPLRKVFSAGPPDDDIRLSVVQAIQNEIKQAFVHGFARGVASEVARFPPADPVLGDVR